MGSHIHEHQIGGKEAGKIAELRRNGPRQLVVVEKQVRNASLAGWAG